MTFRDFFVALIQTGNSHDVPLRDLSLLRTEDTTEAVTTEVTGRHGPADGSSGRRS